MQLSLDLARDIPEPFDDRAGGVDLIPTLGIDEEQLLLDTDGERCLAAEGRLDGPFVRGQDRISGIRMLIGVAQWTVIVLMGCEWQRRLLAMLAALRAAGLPITTMLIGSVLGVGGAILVALGGIIHAG